MDVTPLIGKGQQVIQSYAAGVFRISGVTYEEAVFVFPDKTLIWDAPSSFSSLSVKNFQPLIEQADEIDVVLLGTGSKMEFLPPALRQALKEVGLVIDIMDTGAACRTYNVLMAEGRRVTAALLPSHS